MEYEVTLRDKTNVKIEAESLELAYVKVLKKYRENAIGIAISTGKSTGVLTPVLDYYVHNNKNIDANLVVEMLIEIESIIADNYKKYGKFIGFSHIQDQTLWEKYGLVYANWCGE